MWRSWAAGALLMLSAAAADGEAVDRLVRFRELGRLLADAGDGITPFDGEAALGELFALADAEVVDSLRAGDPYASAAFIQERLDGLVAAWGGAILRVQQLGRPGEGPPLTLGVFAAPGSAPVGSVRIYGRGAGGAPALLAASTHDGTPELHAWPPARDGASQFAATWLGAASGRGGRPLAIELWRRGRAHGAERTWSSAAAFPAGLWALDLGVTSGAISVRYEPRYPGWKPGCEGQTEHADVYRSDPRREGLILAGRRLVHGWHRELQAAVGRLLSALGGGDTATVAALVPDAALRARLPRALTQEPACDQTGAGAPSSVVVAASEARDGRMVPWSLTWRRGAKGWRLAAASPMLE